MLSIFHAALLGLVEGLTEFVPISSTGHLILVDRWLGRSGPAAEAFEIVIQLGALLACAVYYRKLLANMVRGMLRPSGVRERRLALSLACGFVPTAIVGLLLHDAIEARLFGPRPVAIALIGGGLLMIVAERVIRAGARGSSIDDVHELPFHRAAIVGVVQCLSLWPGTSRSMSSIVGGLVVGLTTRAASDFAFLLGLPTLGAACLYKLLKSHEVLMREVGVSALATGLIVSFVVGWLVIATFLRYLQRTGLTPFGIYRILLGGIVLALIV